eukprot:TRINITY_DN102382_c0_g1_i1.p1 TRINITY_DN102382_c0_g1~~TRINITY_DN102382_c0_g1_i1.p1  ORF type:complete len:333 (+),score=46.52 TRINITY_DN102382_c0_g1_i1:147-1145(+)
MLWRALFLVAACVSAVRLSEVDGDRSRGASAADQSDVPNPMPGKNGDATPQLDDCPAWNMSSFATKRAQKFVDDCLEEIEELELTDDLLEAEGCDPGRYVVSFASEGEGVKKLKAPGHGGIYCARAYRFKASPSAACQHHHLFSARTNKNIVQQAEKQAGDKEEVSSLYNTEGSERIYDPVAHFLLEKARKDMKQSKQTFRLAGAYWNAADPTDWAGGQEAYRTAMAICPNWSVDLNLILEVKMNGHASSRGIVLIGPGEEVADCHDPDAPTGRESYDMKTNFPKAPNELQIVTCWYPLNKPGFANFEVSDFKRIPTEDEQRQKENDLMGIM